MTPQQTKGSTDVSEYISKLDPGFADLVEAVRQVILHTDKEIAEQIKWNSPGFFYTGEIKAFDPKEYKRDIVVMNLRKAEVLLVFPTGARIHDASGFLEGKYTDGRKIAKIRNMDELEKHRKKLSMVLKGWLETVEK
jgi:hypothetical protein